MEIFYFLIFFLDIHRQLNYLFQEERTVSPQQAVAIVLSFATYHNRKILQSTKPLWDSTSLQNLKPSFTANLLSGFGFASNIQFSLERIENPQEIDVREVGIDEDMKPLNIVSTNVRYLTEIYKSLDGIITMQPEEILFCSPLRKVKNFSEMTKNYDPLFNRRLLDLGVKLCQVSFHSLTSLLLHCYYENNPASKNVDNLDLTNIVDEMGLVVILLSDDVKHPVLSSIPFQIKSANKIILAQNKNLFYLTEPLVIIQDKSGDQSHQDDASNSVCKCGKGRTTKTASCGSQSTRGCPCFTKKKGCAKQCQCISCSNPFGKRPTKTFCGCKGSCDTKRYELFSNCKIKVCNTIFTIVANVVFNMYIFNSRLVKSGGFEPILTDWDSRRRESHYMLCLFLSCYLLLTPT